MTAPKETSLVDAGAESPQLSILIVTYNSMAFIDDCLTAIPSACGGLPHEILLIDNGQDGTGDYVEREYPSVCVIPSRGNVGFGEGNNHLAAHANPGSKYIVLVNPDTRLYAESIKRLVEVGEAEPDFAALGGAMVSPEGKTSSMPMEKLPSIKLLAYGAVGLADRYVRQNSTIKQDNKVTCVEAINGGFMLIRRSVWDRLNGFDDTYFLYCEDADICKRINDGGAKVGVVPEARIYHDVGSGEFFSPTRIHYQTIALAHYANRNFQAPYRIAFKLMLWGQCLSRFLAGSVLAWRSEKFAALGRAFRGPALNPGYWVKGFDSKGADPRRNTP